MGQHDSVITCAKSHGIENEKKLHVIFASEKSLLNLNKMQAYNGAASTLKLLSKKDVQMSLICLDIKKQIIQQPEHTEVTNFFKDDDFFGLERSIPASIQEKIRTYAKRKGVRQDDLHSTIAIEFVFAAVANEAKDTKTILLCTTAEELTCANYAKMDAYLLKDLANMDKINELPTYVEYNTIEKAY